MKPHDLKLPVLRETLPPPPPSSLDDYNDFVCMLADARGDVVADDTAPPEDYPRFTLEHVNPKLKSH